MAAVVTASPGKLSVPATPSKWPNPELSIGVRCGSMDVLGRYKCWTLKEKSPAHLVWKVVSKTIKFLLEDQFEHLDSDDKELMVEMLMIGRKEVTASPTILFSCDHKVSRRRAMELVQKKEILFPHPGVLMAECSRLPRLLAREGVPETKLSPGVYASWPLKHAGISILISSASGGPLRKATLGGLVLIDGIYYGLTAGHAFLNDKELDRQMTPDNEFAFYGLGEPEYSSEDEDSLLDATTGSQGWSRKAVDTD